MNGIYPDYVGPTVAHRHVSLFPDWVGELATTIRGGIASGASKLSTLIRREEEEILALVTAFTEVIRRR
jgi:hypothetical protein